MFVFYSILANPNDDSFFLLLDEAAFISSAFRFEMRSELGMGDYFIKIVEHSSLIYLRRPYSFTNLFN